MSEFDCDYCGQFGMCEYLVTITDGSELELCDDCTQDALREGDVLKLSKMAVTP